jgi:hypothetical protein
MVRSRRGVRAACRGGEGRAQSGVRGEPSAGQRSCAGPKEEERRKEKEKGRKGKKGGKKIGKKKGKGKGK